MHIYNDFNRSGYAKRAAVLNYKVTLDTGVVIELLRDQDPAIGEFVKGYHSGIIPAFGKIVSFELRGATC